MSEKINDKYKDLEWVKGSRINTNSIVRAHEEFRNEETGERLEMIITGPGEFVEDYLKDFKFAFRVFDLNADEIANLKLDLENKDKDQLGFIDKELERSSVKIKFSFPDRDKPYKWDVFIDPVIQKIRRKSIPHVYNTDPAHKIDITLNRYLGSLDMESGKYSPVIRADAAFPLHEVPRFSWNEDPQIFSIKIDGINDRNQYDLKVSGARLWRVW